MRAQLRNRLLMAALASSLAATAWVASRDEEGSEPGASTQKPARSGTATTRLPASQGLPTGWPAALVSPAASEGPAWPEPAAIARLSWGLAGSAAPEVALAPPPGKSKAGHEGLESLEAEAAPPAAPPIAYQLLGRMDEAGRPRIVLSNAQRTLVVGVGELIDQQWRIDAIGPSGAQLTWLAGGQKQNLAFSSP
jgi:hypothetical protein